MSGVTSRSTTTGPKAPAALPPRDRLSRYERRSHLLDVAAGLLVAGEVPVSMESLAKAAGVSKALPYKHFDNVTAVQVALYQREARRLARRVWRALGDAEPGADLVQVWVASYFDSLAEHGTVLRALSTPGSGIPSLADPQQAGVRGVASVLRRFLGVDRQRAKEVSGLIQGGMVGAAVAWMDRSAKRPVVEALVVNLVRSVIDPAVSPSEA
jgi:AcrR family transcriptional regulator